MRVEFALGILMLGAVLVAVLLSDAVLDELLPNDHERIVGIAVGDLDNTTRIPRRALNCTPSESSSMQESCSITIDGEVLRVDIEYDRRSGLQFHRCEVSYGPITTPCRATGFALGG